VAAHGGGGAAGAWEVRDGEPVGLGGFQHPEPNNNVFRLALSADGRTAVCAHLNGAATVWEVPQVGPPRQRDPLTVAAGPLGQRPADALVVPAGGGSVMFADGVGGFQVWDLGAAGPKRRPLPARKESGARVLPGGRVYARWTGSQTELADAATGAAKVTVPEGVAFPAFLDEGETVLAAANGNRVKLWDVRPGVAALLGEAEAETNPHWLLAPGDGRTLLTGHHEPDGVALVRLWHWGDGKLTEAGRFRPDAPTGWRSADLSRTGTVLALGMNGATEVWSLAKPELARLLTVPGSGDAVAVSPDGRLLALDGGGGQLSVRSVETGRVTWSRKLPGPCGRLVFSPDGRHLVTTNANGTVYVLRLDGPPEAAGPQ
jgi:hypothetical protein